MTKWALRIYQYARGRWLPQLDYPSIGLRLREFVALGLLHPANPFHLISGSALGCRSLLMPFHTLLRRETAITRVLSWKLGAGSTNLARRIRTAHLVNVLGPDGFALSRFACVAFWKEASTYPVDGRAASAVTDDSGFRIGLP